MSISIWTLPQRHWPMLTPSGGVFACFIVTFPTTRLRRDRPAYETNDRHAHAISWYCVPGAAAIRNAPVRPGSDPLRCNARGVPYCVSPDLPRACARRLEENRRMAGTGTIPQPRPFPVV